MDERLTKRRGPLLWLKARSRWFWIAMALLPVLYVASFGPACWWLVGECHLRTGFANAIAARKAASSPPFRTVYWPIGWLAENGPTALTNAITWYATLRCDSVFVPCDCRGDNCVLLGDAGFF